MIPADAQRILRQAWGAGDLNTFAEELLTLFNSRSDVTHNGQLILTQTTNKPAIVIKNLSGDGNRVLQLQDATGADLGGFTVGGVSKIGGPGGITLGATDQGPIAVGRNDLSGVQFATTPPPTTAGSSNSGPLVIDFSKGRGTTVAASLGTAGQLGSPGKPATSGGSSGGGGIPCQVGAQVGGPVYSGTLYPNGVSAASITANVTQLQIATGDVIPSGTWAVASLGADGTYTMQCPVWA